MNALQLEIGQKISFTTNSSIYREVYETEIIGVYPDHLDLRITLHRGYLLLIPSGTVIRWLLPNEPNKSYTSMVLGRSIADHTWSVTYPQMMTPSSCRVITISSGKGGVGKTTFSINFALALRELNQKVTLLDADIGTANIEILLGMATHGNLTHVINGDCSLRDIVALGPNDLQVIAGSSGTSALTSLNTIQFNRIYSGFLDLQEISDYLIIDTGAGISDLVLNFIEASDEFFLITTPEPHALMDAYALLKALAFRTQKVTPKIIVNNCESRKEGMQSRNTINQAAKKFLNMELDFLGWLPNERQISKSLKMQKPILLSHPHCEYSQSVMAIARQYAVSENGMPETGGILSFLKKFRSFALK